MDIARQVLAVDGIPVDELSEHLAVARQCAGEPSEPPELPVSPPETVSSASGTLSLEIAPPESELDGTEPEPEPEPEVAAIP